MKFLIIAVVLAVVCDARVLVKRAEQQPKIWDALKVLRGGKDLTTEEIQDLLNNAVAGKDYPVNAVVPDKAVDCSSYSQPGFYADDSEPSKCQVFHRCDENGKSSSYLCPNETLFNQITLICDWFVNVDCSVSKQFVDYSNSRLGDPNAKLLDDQMEIIVASAAAIGEVKAKPAPAKKPVSAAKPAAGKVAAKPAAAKPAAKVPGPARGSKGLEEEAPGASNTVSVEATTQATASEETTAAAAVEETQTTSAASETTSSAPSAEETTGAEKAAPSEATTIAGPEVTTAAVAAEETTAAAPEVTTATSAEVTTAAAAEVTTAAVAQETTASAVEESTTAAVSPPVTMA
jgi:hypothetical protein